ncbi:PREDICTED: uncharacterized protein LOC105146724 [Acromyrmex echinatior]|uniref:uncharacterized protein LOC105146724 n=1 Tax=Acromyrmex echinatior TaxID=103372 RepID=UPI00058102B7|nr:PREDICTED: uncharacterized protein LOC105146724 [Acromyrmex echinatior]
MHYLVYSYPRYVHFLSALIWASIIRYVGSRFHQVNDCLHVLYSDLFENNADYRGQNRCLLVNHRITGTKNHMHYIWIIIHVHLQLCLISRKLNKVFNIQILLQMLLLFTETMTFFIHMYLLFTNTGNIIISDNRFLFINVNFQILNSIFFLTLNYVCQTVYDKINETVAILHKLSSYNFDENLHEQILQFILQIKQREVKFGMEPFYLGYAFIREFYKTALSVVVILIQMDLINIV